MKISYPYLKDKDFLLKLVKLPLQEYIIKISLLEWQEEVIEEIQGKVISGNINVDSKSAVRRTGSLSINFDMDTQGLLIIGKKVYIQIGYENFTDQYTDYPIIWFPQGVFVLTEVSFAETATAYTASITFKDKMCLLNGQCGGTLPASVVFDNMDTIDDEGNEITIRPTIYQIIRELVHHWGGEQEGKIIISDLDLRIKQALKWTGNGPLYFLVKNQTYYITSVPSDYEKKKGSQGYSDIEGSPFESQSPIGYTYVDFTFPGELVGNGGDTVVTILDKIKEILGNFEYFYDIDGNFIFQQIKNYLNNSQSKYVLESLHQGQFVADYLSSTGQAYLSDPINGEIGFDFEGNDDLIISCNNQPQFNNIFNDFVIWGTRTSANSNISLPIRYHVAIDKKPKIGHTYTGVFKYVDPQFGAQKWYKPIEVQTLPDIGLYGVFYHKTSESNKVWQYSKNNWISISVELCNVTTKDWRTQLYFQGVLAESTGTESNDYYAELVNEWPLLYNILPDKNGKNDSDFKEQVIKDPTLVNYFLDFIEPEQKSALANLSIEKIGRRTKVINDNQGLNCIFEAYMPDIVLIEIGSPQENIIKQQCQAKGQDYYQTPASLYGALLYGGSYNSCYEEIRQTIQDYVNYNENINLQTVPILFLEPNSYININNDTIGVSGRYFVNTYSLSFSTTNLSMSITAQKIINKI